ncbi:MAG: T9SS type A sorting domain-containing protein [Crocinitomicaceae bacterium]
MYKSTLLLFALVMTSLVFGQTTYYVESTTDNPADNLSFRYQINQANVNPGHDTIRFGAGSATDSIFFDSTIVITEGVTIIGRGQDTTFLVGRDPLTGSGIIQIYNSTPGNFRFFQFHMISASQDSCFGIAQDLGTTGDTLLFERVEFTRLQFAVFIDAAQNTVILNDFCKFSNNLYALNCQVNLEYLKVNECLFTGQRGAGAYIQSNYFEVTNNIFENQAANPGMASVVIVDPVSPGGISRFVNNTVQDGNEVGLLLYDANSNMSNIAIHNNIIYGNSYDFRQDNNTGSALYSKNIIGTTDPSSQTFPIFYSNADPMLSISELTSASITAIDSADATYAPLTDYFGLGIVGSGRDIGAIEYLSPCSLLSANFSVTDATCYSAGTGAITTSVSGGTAPYTYQWSNSGAFNETTQDLSNIWAGDYFIYIQDNAGCNFYDTVTVGQATQIVIDSASIVITPTGCGNSDGAISGLSVSGGNPPYSYNWFNGGPSLTSTIDISGVPAGTGYLFRVIDANSCPVFSNLFTIPSNDSLISLNLNTANANCNASFSGSAYVNPSGGASPYSYTWSNGATSDSIINLSAGNYWVFVNDANGCQSQAEYFTIQDSSAIQIATAVTPATCGSNDGSIVSTVLGGTLPYFYSWSQAGLSGSSVQNLYTGYYQLTITDANGCSNFTNVFVPASGISISASSTSPSCDGSNDGAIDITVNPAGSYTYLWSNGATTEDASNLYEGFYTVTVSNGSCSFTDSFSIDAPDALQIIHTTSNATGCTSADGMIAVTAFGGSPAYSYELFDENSSLGAGPTFANLVPGPYMAVAVDANGCSDTATISLSGISGGATPLTAGVTNITPSACLSSNPADPGNGSALVTANGGTAPYAYYWTKYWNQSGSGLGSGTVFSTTNQPINLSSGAYVVEVRDANNCSIYVNTTIPGANLAPQEICMVTVQQDFNNNQQNVVVWEKNAGLGIDYYEIWRMEANGMWQYRDSVQFASLSQYVDYGTDPNATYYTYQLRTVDQCGNQSVYTANHATIQLSLDTLNMTPATGPNNTDGSITMQWNQYGGSLSLTEYGVRRIIVESGVTVADAIIATVPFLANNPVYNYTDNTMPGDNGQRSVFYQIQAVFPSSCLATKAQDYNGTRSNRSAGIFNGGYPASLDESDLNYFAVYPNPSNGKFTIETSQAGGTITVIDLFGKIVKELEMNQVKIKVDLSELNNGTYFIRYNGNQVLETKKVIILNN